MNTQETIETAIRFALKDDDGRLYAPIAADPNRPHVYVPGYNVHAGGDEVHMISVYRNGGGSIEVLVNNGYTVTDGPLVNLLRSAIEAA